MTPTQTKKVTLGFSESLKLAVVGHTNTGKTSILRTLLRDQYFGEVKNATATTRHVEKAVIVDNQTTDQLVSLFDTPGLEDASGVMDWLEDHTPSRKDGVERLQIFLQNVISDSEDNSSEDFSQEAKVIKQVLGSNIAIYVIDSREPVLSKYKDELTILSWSAIPIMPVFNFIEDSESNYVAEWQEMLARRNLHVSTKFDSVAFEFEDEILLWNNLATMLIDNGLLIQLITKRQENWQSLHDEATILIADFLLNVASFVKEIDDKEDPTPILSEMQEAVRQAERSMHKNLLDLYKFYDNQVATTVLSLEAYQQDPFDSEVLKSYGIRTSSGAAAGALVGMGIDAAALGTTLGLGTALGSLAGGILSNTSKLAYIITGTKRLYIDPATITLLATRSRSLLSILRHRGHADQNHTINDNSLEHTQSSANLTPWSVDHLPKLLKKARSKPEWSSLDGKDIDQSKLLRADSAWKLSNQLALTKN